MTKFFLFLVDFISLFSSSSSISSEKETLRIFLSSVPVSRFSDLQASCFDVPSMLRFDVSVTSGFKVPATSRLDVSGTSRSRFPIPLLRSFSSFCSRFRRISSSWASRSSSSCFLRLIELKNARHTLKTQVLLAAFLGDFSLIFTKYFKNYLKGQGVV